LKKDGDNYSLRADHQDNDKRDYDKSWNFPTDFSTLNFNFEPTDEDIESAMIDLAGWLSVRITAWERARGGGKATNAKLSAEQRSAAARHAGKNRWKKR
jgi:hypothetical protein